MHEHDAVPQCEVDQPAEHLLGRHGAGRHLRIVQYHHPDVLQAVPFDILQVGHPSPFGRQPVFDRFAAREGHSRTVCRVSRIGYQHAVAPPQVCHADMHQTLLGSYQRKYFACRVERHTVTVGIPPCKGLAQHRRALVGLIGVGIVAQCDLVEFLHHRRMGRTVRRPDTERYYTSAGRTHLIDLAQLA